MMTGYGQGLGWNMMSGWFGWLVMMFFGFLVLVGVVLLVIWAVRASSQGGHSGSGPVSPATTGHDEAVAVARKRLASGEITPEQFEEIMRALGG
jgi:putative membrane protein